MSSSWGAWGKDLLGQAQEQLAQAQEQLAPGLEKVGSALHSGTKSLRKSLQENLATGISGETHYFDGLRGEPSRSVSEVAFLAEGAFGAVMKVSDSRTGEKFALKKVACAEGVQVASSFEAAEREAKVLSRLPTHPNIIRCYGWAVDKPDSPNSTVKILLELCPGGHLLDYMDSKDGKLSPREVMEPFVQITEAVKFLHSQKPPLQHRDLKVENVLKGDDGQWKLCDFGSCSSRCVPSQELSRPEMHKLQEEIDKTVTMLYRPPEMADIDMNHRQGYAIGSAVDIWMLGCILFTLAFYRHPFQDNAFAMAIWNAKYFIPQDHPMARSLKLCALIHWLLAPDPKDRPSAGGTIEACRNIGKIEYADFLGSLPSSVQKKISQSEALYTKRRDVAPPPEWDLSRISNGGTRSSGSRNGTDKPRHHEVRQSAQEPEFDLRFALSTEDTAASAPSGGSGATKNRGSSNGGYAASKPAKAPSPAEDLLSLGEPTGTTGGHFQSAASAPAMDDLLGFAPDPTTASRAKSAPAAAQGGGNLLGFADFDSQASFPAAAPGTGQQPTGFNQPSAINASLDFADFSAAPAPDFGAFQQPPPVQQPSGSPPMGMGQPSTAFGGSPMSGMGQQSLGFSAPMVSP
eukprot:CAMPEP_0197630844 /NCGR_PEP_ID=MMETSP1338-20131121/8202_1 /TAXON_ID=43686 ORGANISM="Pelagodinium beii, Strain RCC1491" /NCGR_SAMPLE_ID=MMETSP1338 /ASSEMBLY_ACC=CAM_ASM_000754 /LENGTH=630 /DNA_ID=CAMNT_0043202157 /DNA_START=53 /DNA_END=1942 /DNA_ORIENTATION=+